MPQEHLLQASRKRFVAKRSSGKLLKNPKEIQQLSVLKRSIDAVKTIKSI
jgi:hypothetical protein